MEQYQEVKYGDQTNEGYESVLFPDGDKGWYRDGCLHREDNYAFEYCDGVRVWCLNGKQIGKGFFRQNPHLIAKMQAWELFEPEELIRLKLTGKPWFYWA